MKLKTRLTVTLGTAVVVLLLGCASSPKPFTYHPNTEIKEGPGLFSGEKGEIVLYDSKKENRSRNAPGDPAADTPKADPGQIRNEEEFRQFRQWQQDQQELERFKEWKNSPQGQKELEEFRQWQRWQEYQKWRQSHPEEK